MTQAARQLTRLTVLCLSLHSFNVAPAPTFESTWLIEELAKADAPLIYLVGLNLAMLDMLGNDVHMAAALIGHELAHLKLNHGRERSEKGGGATFEANRFSRDNEREADYLGAVWAHEAGYDLAGAIRLEEALYSLQKRRQGYSVTHPMGIERTLKIKSLARRLGRKAHHSKPGTARLP